MHNIRKSRSSTCNKSFKHFGCLLPHPHSLASSKHADTKALLQPTHNISCRDTAPFQSANDVLVHIGKRLEMDLAVSYHSWPSSQSLPAITRPVLPKDVTSYVTQLEGISDTVAKSLEAATASFKNPKRLETASIATKMVLLSDKALMPPPQDKVHAPCCMSTQPAPTKTCQPL